MAYEQIRRTQAIEEITNFYFIHPIAGWLAPWLSRLGVKPNAVSLAGMFCGLWAAVFYYHFREPRYVVVGFLLMVIWHILDGADGQLARLTHTQSQLGKIMDGICDYVTFIAVYTALGVALSAAVGLWVWSVIVASGICHAVQAATYEVQRQEYCFWGCGQKSAELPGLNSSLASADGASSFRRILNGIYAIYVRLQWRVAGVTLESREKLRVLIGDESDDRSIGREKYCEMFAPAIRQWNILSANYRTLGIFLAVLFEIPMWYFAYEIVVLSVVTLYLIGQKRRLYARLLNELDARPLSNPA